ncbi:putative phage tail protein, partial [Escherichia coli]
AQAISDVIATAADDARQMLRERFPSTSRWYLGEWESFLGLPDCTSENGTLSERQRAAANKMRMTGNLSRRFYEWLAAQYGFTVRLTDSTEGQWVTQVNIYGIKNYRNATVLDNVLTPLRVYESGALECLLEKYKPAHQIYKFVYHDGDN